MDELEIYGSRRAQCPLYGEGYYKRALNVLNVGGSRKKQAVTKTSSAATKALIHKNHLASPLLKLPSEIREEILGYLVGGQVVHVQFVHHEQPEEIIQNGVGLYEQPNRTGALRHAICVAKETEFQAYAQATEGYSNIPPSESAEHHITCCADRHQTCYFTSRTSGLKEVYPDLKLNLAVLGVCRQLYEQAHHILWTTNTFSFDDPVSLGKFMASLNSAQLHKLKSLHLSRLVSDLKCTTPWADRVTDHWAWTIACEPSRIKVLHGLRTLHVCLEQYLHRHDALTSLDDHNRRCLQQDAQPFLQLRILALEHVTVIVADNPSRMEVPSIRAARWTAAEKNQTAEEIRVKLLDPEGAASLKAEEDAKKLELEGNRLDKVDRIEKRKIEREEEAKTKKARGEQAEQAKTKVINNHLEQQIGGTVRRSWMKTKKPDMFSF